MNVQLEIPVYSHPNEMPLDGSVSLAILRPQWGFDSPSQLTYQGLYFFRGKRGSTTDVPLRDASGSLDNQPLDDGWKALIEVYAP